MLTGIAIVLYPGGTILYQSDHGYSFFHNSLSDLGSIVAWNGEPNVGRPFYLAASIIFVIAGASCFLALLRVYSNSLTVRWLGHSATIAILLSAVGLLGAALAPPDRYPVLHGHSSLFTLVCFSTGTAFLTLATALDPRLRRRVMIGWFVLTSVVVTWAAMILVAQPTTELQLAIPVTLQKVAGVTLVATLVFQGYEAEHMTAAR